MNLKTHRKGLFLLVMGGLSLLGCGEPKEFSPFARKLLSEGTWTHLQGRFVHVHTQDPERAATWVREADHAFEQTGSWLDLDPVEGTGAHLFIISDHKLWQEKFVEAGLRQDGEAFHNAREVFALVPEEAELLATTLAHEMVHVRIGMSYPDTDVPLWFEEGLAGYLGWEIAKAYGNLADLKLDRKVEPVPAEHWIPLEELVRSTRYPDNREKAHAFYRESEELVRGLARAVGRNALGELAAELARGEKGWEEVLANTYSSRPEDIESIQKLVRQESEKSTVE